MKILILNWRSIKDPLEGGAERATHEFAKRWVQVHNAEVFWISPKYDKNINEETIDGVKFIYLGIPLTRSVLQLLYAFPVFYFGVMLTYLKKFKNNIDVVIDQVHGIPYLTPLYVKEKKLVYIHEVAGSIWDIMYPRPIVWLGHLAEIISFYFYKKFNIPFIANSPSTYSDLTSKLKIKKQNINIVYYGVTAPKISHIPQKSENFSLLYVNRLVKMKGIERALKVFRLVLDKVPNAQFNILGRGEESYLHELKDLANDLNIQNNVHFLGHIDGDAKFDIYAKSHVFINSSYLEGWGLVNIEANRMGTPVVAFDVRGCRDSVKHGVSGYLSKDNDLQDIANNIIKLKGDTAMQKSAQEYAAQFDWDLQAERFYTELKK